MVDLTFCRSRPDALFLEKVAFRLQFCLVEVNMQTVSYSSLPVCCFQSIVPASY